MPRLLRQPQQAPRSLQHPQCRWQPRSLKLLDGAVFSWPLALLLAFHFQQLLLLLAPCESHLARPLILRTQASRGLWRSEVDFDFISAGIRVWITRHQTMFSFPSAYQRLCQENASLEVWSPFLCGTGLL